jgi:hypothetical protein
MRIRTLKKPKNLVTPCDAPGIFSRVGTLYQSRVDYIAGLEIFAASRTPELFSQYGACREIRTLSDEAYRVNRPRCHAYDDCSVLRAIEDNFGLDPIHKESGGGTASIITSIWK